MTDAEPAASDLADASNVSDASAAARQLRHDVDEDSAAAGDALARSVRAVDPERSDRASGGEDATDPDA